MLIHNADITGSLTINGVPYNTGSFTGSFFGDGSQLSGVTSYTNADTLAFIQGYSGSYSGSFSGSFFGDGSNLSGVTSYTDADTLDFINSLNVVSGSIQTVSTVSDTFTSVTSYTVTHNFGTKEVIVSVYENDTLIFPSSINTPTVNTVTITFPEPVTGRVVVVKAGHIVSGSINYNSVLNKPTLVSGSSQISFTGISNKPTLVSGSSQITYSGLTGIPSGIVSGSSQITYSGITGKPSGIVSGSSQIAALGYATTGSNIFQGNQTITGSLFITQNLVVAGSSSIQYISSSVLDIANNIITVNVLNPSVRFGGLAVIDSGSSPQRSGSMLFDSIKDEWIFVHQNQSTITSSVVLMGPETYNNLGNETYLSANRLPKGSGVEHLRDSNITDTGTVVSINSNTRVTGSLGVTGSLTVNGTVYAGGATSASALTGASELIVQNEIGIQSADSTGPFLRMVAGSVNQNFTLVTGAASGSEPNLLFNVGGSTRLTISGSGAATFSGLNLTLNNTGATGSDPLLTIQSLGGGNPRLKFLGQAGVINRGAVGDSLFFGETADTGQYIFRGTGAATFSSSVTANSTINGYLGTIAAGQTPATSGTTPVNPMLNLTNNRGVGMYFGGSYAGNYAQWIQVSDTGNLGVNYPLLLNPNGGNVGIGTASPSAALNVSNVPTSFFGIIETTGTSAGTVKHFRVHKPGYVEYGIGILDTNAFHISTASTFPTTNGFTITSDGNVGIGNTNPKFYLHSNDDVTIPNNRYLNFTTEINAANFNKSLVVSYTDNSATSQPNQIGLILHNNSNTDNTFSPALVFGSKSTSNNYSQATAAIAGKRLTLQQDPNWHSGELYFWTATSGGASISQGIPADAPAMILDSRRRMRVPSQPSFRAGRSASYNPGADSNIVFNSVFFNIGSHYNASNGLFTAPIAGRYYFSASVIWESLSDGQQMDDAFTIRANGSVVAYDFRRAEYVAGTTGNDGYYVTNANILLNLAANDTVSIRNNRSLTVHGNEQFSWFVGYLLG